MIYGKYKTKEEAQKIVSKVKKSVDVTKTYPVNIKMKKGKDYWYVYIYPYPSGKGKVRLYTV
jgi:leucyl-tRNA synthetase